MLLLVFGWLLIRTLVPMIAPLKPPVPGVGAGVCAGFDVPEEVAPAERVM